MLILMDFLGSFVDSKMSFLPNVTLNMFVSMHCDHCIIIQMHCKDTN